MRNSWGGSGYGYDSYFWLSYYDKSLDTATAMEAIPDQYDHCYAYNGSPILAWYPMQSGQVMTEQHYSISGGETISAVGVETRTADLDVSLSLSCAGKTVTQSFRTTYPGYYLIPLNDTLPVSKGSTATLKITYSGKGGIEIPVERSKPLRRNKLVFGLRNPRKNGLLLHHPRIDVLLLEDALHHLHLVGRHLSD